MTFFSITYERKIARTLIPWILPLNFLLNVALELWAVSKLNDLKPESGYLFTEVLVTAVILAVIGGSYMVLLYKQFGSSNVSPLWKYSLGIVCFCAVWWPLVTELSCVALTTHNMWIEAISIFAWMLCNCAMFFYFTMWHLSNTK